MKKVVFVFFVLLLGLSAFFLAPDSGEEGVQPYHDSDSQLLIPQRNVVIATIDLAENDRSFFSEETIRMLEDLNDDLIGIKGVTQVDSILNASTVRSDEYEIFVSPIIPVKSGRSDAFYRDLPQELGKYPELKPYISPSQDSLLFYIYFGYKVIPADIDKALAGIQTKYQQLSLEYTGKSPIVAQTEKLLTDDILIFLPLLVILVMMVFLSLRNVRAIASSWVLILLSVFASYSFVRFFGVEISPMLLLVPVFSLGLLSDYIIHYYYHLFYAPGSHDPFYVRRRLLFPLSMTAISTLTGFLSLLFINGSGHLLLGSIISVSVVLTYLGVFFWYPYQNLIPPQSTILPRFHVLQVRFFSFIVRGRRYIYFGLILVFIGGLYLIPQLKIEPYPLQQLPEDNTIRKADTVINKDFYGSIPYFLEIDTGEEGGIISLEGLHSLDKVHEYLESREVIGYSYSLLTVLKRLSHYFEGDQEMILQQDDLLGSFIIEQYLLYYSSSVDPLEYESLINADYRVFSIKGLLYYHDVDSLRDFYGVIEEIRTMIPESWTLTVHGMTNDLQLEERTLKRNWIFSFAIGSFMIFIMVLIFYRKSKMALMSLIPGILSMICSFGIISLAGINIDAFSIIFVAIIIGLVIDYSIHTLGAIESLEMVNSLEEGFSYIIEYSGKPIFLSFLTSVFSFSVLFLSSFRGARTLGLLLVSSLLISFFLSVYLLPIIILPNRLKRENSEAKDQK